MTTQTDLNNGTTNYFDLHVSGLGYVNRVREVQVKRGEPFWACDIAALHGVTADTQYTYFDCRVSGSEAEGLIKRYEKPITDGKKVLIGFKLGDLYAEAFVYGKGKKQGETGVSLKARLLFISWIKVDGETVYKAPRKTEADQANAKTPAAGGEAPKAEAVTEQNAAVAA
jgi:hypothetical protein